MKYFTILLFFFILYASKAQTDQELVYGTYFGGENTDFISSSITDSVGNLYIVGRTYSETNIATSGSYQESFNGIADGFIAKFNYDYNLIWSTYFGGEGFDEISDIVVLVNGDIIVTGNTDSEADIATIDAYQETFGGFRDAFLARFSTDGELIWSTYFGGSNYDIGKSLAIDLDENIFIVGTLGSDGMATSGSYQENRGGGLDGLCAKFSNGGALIWATYYGGEFNDEFVDIKINISQELNLLGITSSETNIATTNVHQESLSGIENSFIVKFTLAGDRNWATYYGGESRDIPYSINTDFNNNIIISGYTDSDTGIATPGAHKTIREFTDAYLASFNSEGQINWGTYFGGERREEDSYIEIKGDDIYFTGRTDSEEGIANGSPYQAEYAGPYNDVFNPDIYLSKFNSGGQQVWGTYYGNTGFDGPNKILLIEDNLFLLTGGSTSTEGLTTQDAMNPENAGLADGLFAVFNVDLLISVNEIKSGELSVYPNPANNYFIINLPLTLPENGMVEIYTLEGKRIAVFDHYISGNRIPLNLAPGMYIVSYRSGSVELRTKLMVE